MLELTLVFICLSLVFYVLLGGADFGAGIIEIFTGRKGSNTISRAIAPVWEANHIWLIVVIVILFNAFPQVYSTITLYLHIPIMLVLFGIIFRGTAFTFRYYDPFNDRSHNVYTFLFQLFSLLTPFFLGVTLGAVILGRMSTDNSLPFHDLFIAPWLTWFSAGLGIFLILLFAFLAAAFLAGEPAEKDIREQFKRYAGRLLISLVIMGTIVFILAEIDGLSLFKKYTGSWISIVSAIAVTLLLPAFFYALKHDRKNLIRFVAGAQTAGIIIGWFGVQYPQLVILKGSESLTVNNTMAPDQTLLMMIIALLVGLAFVIPLLVYLFRVFKFSDRDQDL